LEFTSSEELIGVARRSSIHEIAVSRASGARKLNYWGEFFWKRREEKKKSVNSELVIMSYVAVKGPNETHM
jgi:hypothetical protein